VAEFSHWLWCRHLTVRDITVTSVKRFLRSRVLRQPVGPGSASCLRAFLELLYRNGVIAAPISTVRKTPVAKVLGEFSLYLQQERALAPGTITNYLSDTEKFWAHRFRRGPINMSKLTVAQVVESVRHLALPIGRKRAKVMTSALRTFLRYARYQDLIRADLAACVPCVADWSGASIPKGLPIVHVKRALACCDRRSAIGRRDYAILLLLARLGLRAGEVCSLQLQDIDWEVGSFTVRGKGNYSAELPLPKDGGRAIAAYLKMDDSAR